MTTTDQTLTLAESRAMRDKVFQTHPAPWRYVDDAAECDNGSSLDSIEDADGETVATSYNSGFYELWSFYEILTDEQKAHLGQGVFSVWRFNDSMSYTKINKHENFDIKFSSCLFNPYWECCNDEVWGTGETPYEALMDAKNNCVKLTVV